MMDLVQTAQQAKYRFVNLLFSHLIHEINNPLTMIYNRSNSLITRLQDGKAEKEHLLCELRKIETSVERVSVFLQNTRNFFKFVPLEASIEYSITEVIDQLNCYLTEAYAKKGIDLKIQQDPNISPDLLLRKGDPQKLLLAFFELIQNSKEAICEESCKAGGTILINLQKSATGLEINISDSGPIFSIKQEDFAKPYTTTKSAHLGIGLAFAKSSFFENSLSMDLLSDRKTIKISPL